jgi:hypothetical protein
MCFGSAADDSYRELGEQAGKAAMNRQERDGVVQDLLGRYSHRVGETMAGDDTCLLRLLATLRLDLEDREVGDYLCSFLVA